jgi:phosphoketolase
MDSAAQAPPGWLSVPLVLTSQTWENSKNEFSHQDPTITEAMLGEAAQVSRVIFPADYNTAAASLEKCYGTHGQIWTIVVPKGKLPQSFTHDEARNLIENAAARVEWLGHKPGSARLILAAVGGYQFVEIAKASARLRERDVPHQVVYIVEPARFRVPRSRLETAHVLSDEKLAELFPATAQYRVFLTHTRPEPVLGIFSRIHTGLHTAGLGFRNDGGTLDVGGMLWVNGCTWAHCLRAAARAMEEGEAAILDPKERRALDGLAEPAAVIEYRYAHRHSESLEV